MRIVLPEKYASASNDGAGTGVGVAGALGSAVPADGAAVVGVAVGGGRGVGVAVGSLPQAASAAARPAARATPERSRHILFRFPMGPSCSEFVTESGADGNHQQGIRACQAERTRFGV